MTGLRRICSGNRWIHVYLLLAGVAACGPSAAEETETAAAEIGLVEQRDLEIRIEAAGLIEPIRVVEVKSNASGAIVRLLVETGDTVERGTLLAEVDPRDARNALALVQADLQVARARLTTAEVQHARARELRDAQVVTEQEYEVAMLEEANARAQFIKARTNLDLTRQKMGDVTIRAPITGTVIAKSVEEGQIVASASANISGGTTLLIMADLSAMQVRALVDETDIGQLRPGQPARVTVEAYPGRTFDGEVTKVEPQAVVEQNVTLFPVLVRLANPEGLLRPGMNAEVAIDIARRQGAVVVPNAAVASLRDAMTAGAALGLEPEDLREAMPGFGPGGGGGGGRGAPGAAGGDGVPAECLALRARLRSGGGPPSDADRAKLAECRRLMAVGGRAEGSSDAATGAGGASRPGLVFVAGPDGPVPRRVILGLSDWDSTEILDGVEPGERVYLISVARLKQQQEEFSARMRERTGGMMPGGGGQTPAGGGQGAPAGRPQGGP